VKSVKQAMEFTLLNKEHVMFVSTNRVKIDLMVYEKTKTIFYQF